jgi:acetyl esterase/lipase
VNRNPVLSSLLLTLSLVWTQAAVAQTPTAAPAKQVTLPPGAPVTWIDSAPPATMVPRPDQHATVLLWPNGAPGSEGKTAGEKYRIYTDDTFDEGGLLVISRVNDPSITVFLPPKGKATGAGIIVAPGGAFREIWITSEGYRVADWLNQHGIAAFVLKYRLQNDENSGYTTEGDSLPDMQRAIRLVRSRAAEWGVDPERVGVMGFSAGSMLSGLAGSRYNDPVAHPVDGVDKFSDKPAFTAMIYGTPFAGPMPSHASIPKDMPPVFLAAGGDDPVSASYPEVYRKLKDVGISVELHIYAGVGHGFGIKPTSPLSVSKWPDRLWEWLYDRGFLTGM